VIYLGDKGERPWVIAFVIGEGLDVRWVKFKTPREALVAVAMVEFIGTAHVRHYPMFLEEGLAAFRKDLPVAFQTTWDRLYPMTEEAMGDKFDLEQHIYLGGWEEVWIDGERFVKIINDGEEE